MRTEPLCMMQVEAWVDRKVAAFVECSCAWQVRYWTTGSPYTAPCDSHRSIQVSSLLPLLFVFQSTFCQSPLHDLCY